MPVNEEARMKLASIIYSGEPDQYPSELPIELRSAYDRYWRCKEKIERMMIQMYNDVEWCVYEYLLDQEVVKENGKA